MPATHINRRLPSRHPCLSFLKSLYPFMAALQWCELSQHLTSALFYWLCSLSCSHNCVPFACQPCPPPPYLIVGHIISGIQDVEEETCQLFPIQKRSKISMQNTSCNAAQSYRKVKHNAAVKTFCKSTQPQSSPGVKRAPPKETHITHGRGLLQFWRLVLLPGSTLVVLLTFDLSALSLLQTADFPCQAVPV